MTGHVLPGGAPLEDPRRPGEEPDLIEHGRDLLARRQATGLPGVAALGIEEVVDPGLDRVGDLQQGPLAFGRRGVAPRLEGRGGRAHGPVDVGAAGDRRGGEDFTGGGVDQIGVGAVDRLDIRPADEVAQYLLLGHFVSRTSMSRVTRLP